MGVRTRKKKFTSTSDSSRFKTLFVLRRLIRGLYVIKIIEKKKQANS